MRHARDDLPADRLPAAQALLPDVRLQHPVRIGGGERTSVDRVRAVHAQERGPTTLVVKHYHSAGEGWVRESAALAVVPADAPTPRLVASGGAPPTVIMTDAGEGASVADALLGDDPGAAARAVVEWADALARLHCATRGLRAQFRRELAVREGDVHVADSPTAARLEDVVRLLDRQCAGLGVRVPAGAFDELRGLAKLLSDSGTAALSPADTCPDNNVRVPGGVVLLDFEDAQWRHVAWDVAYLRVPWPSCWCAWRLPDAVSREAVAAYRRVAGASFPEVLTGDFDAQLEAAELGWALATAGMSLDNALAADPMPHTRRPTPTRRARIQHRLDRAGAVMVLPAAAELARRLATELRKRWGEVPLAYARAFAE
jgi:hypothetical protein